MKTPQPVLPFSKASGATGKGGKGETERGRRTRGTGLNDKTKGGPSYDDINAAKVKS